MKKVAEKWKIEPFDGSDKEITIWAGNIRVVVDNDDCDHEEAERVAKFIADVSPMYGSLDGGKTPGELLDLYYAGLKSGKADERARVIKHLNERVEHCFEQAGAPSVGYEQEIMWVTKCDEVTRMLNEIRDGKHDN